MDVVGWLAVADLFISYSKRDAFMAAHLAAHLESEGFSVWYDRELRATEHYRDEIVRELRAAKAVLVVWSPSSVESDWVRAEASVANSLGTLISLRTETIGYPEIPLPFGEVHIVRAGDLEDVVRAARAKVGQHATLPHAWKRLKAATRSEILGFIGIAGTSLTVLPNLSGLIKFGELASYLLSRWHSIISYFWSHVGSLLSIHIPARLATLLSFFVFAVLMLISTTKRKVVPSARAS